MKEKIKELFQAFTQVKFRGLQGKMIFIGATPVFIASIVMFFVYWQVGSMSSNLNKLVDDTVPALTTSKELTGEVNNLLRFLWQTYIQKDNSEALSTNISAFERAEERLISAHERYMVVKMDKKSDVLRGQADVLLKEIFPHIQSVKKSIEEKK